MQERESEAARWRATKQPRLKDGNMKRKTWRQKRARGETEKQDWHWDATRDSNSRRLRIEDGNKKRNEMEGDKHAGGGTQTDHLPPILLLFDILVNKASLKRIVELTDCFFSALWEKNTTDANFLRYDRFFYCCTESDTESNTEDEFGFPIASNTDSLWWRWPDHQSRSVSI